MFITAMIMAHLTTILVDEFEQSVKSMENCKSAMNRSLNCCPELRQYLDKFVKPAPGDPGQRGFTRKQLIAQEMNESSPLLSFIPEQVPFHVFLNLQEELYRRSTII